MKKFITIIILTTVLLSAVPAYAATIINSDSFPDTAFRTLVQNFDTDHDSILSDSEIATVTEIDCEQNTSIRDVTGIAYFTSLKSLNVWKCPLSKLDVSKNTQLDYLDCCETGISSLDLKSNPNIHQLWCYGNNFTELDLSKCPYLSKAVNNGVYNSNHNGGSASSFADDETDSYLVVDNGTTIKLADKTITVSPKETDSSGDSSGNGTIKFDNNLTDFSVNSPWGNNKYYAGKSIPLSITPRIYYYTILPGGFSVSTANTITMTIKRGDSVEKTFTISYYNTDIQKTFTDSFVPNKEGDYEINIKFRGFDCGSYTIQVVKSNSKSLQTITAKSFTRTLGDKAFSMNAKTNGDGKLTYTSDNTKVATINSSGKVTLKGVGKATITIKASATDNFKKATKKVTVTVKKPTVKATALTTLTNVKGKKMTVKWKKVNGVTGYEVQYTTDKKFKKSVKTVKVKKNTTLRATIKK